MKKTKAKKGISLIVLVITIVVMIILASAIILSISSGDIRGKANEAVASNDLATTKEIISIAQSEWEINYDELKDEYSDFKDYVSRKLKKAGITDIVVSDSGAANTRYTDKNGDVAIIPEGFSLSTLASENIVSEGLVIIDKVGNEFVWVPVEDISTFINNPPAGDNSGEYLLESAGEWNSKIKNDYENMKRSVTEYNGFYIGRYEAGTSVERIGSQSNGTTDVVVQKGKYVYNYVGWGNSITDINSDILDYNGNNCGKGAVILSKNMYRNSKSVASTLCYGTQWDAVMNFMKDVTNPNVSGKKYIEDSTGMGVYGTSTPALTGSDEAYKVKNIYDMAGNMFEWTMEEFKMLSGTVKVSLRGGFSLLNGATFPASIRNAFETTSVMYGYGFRPALYIK